MPAMASIAHFATMVIVLASLAGAVTSRGCCKPDTTVPNVWRCIGVTNIIYQAISPSVQTLHIDCQNRSVLGNLTTEDFQKMTHLTRLTIKNCKTESIGPYTFNQLDKLQLIDLAWNSLKNIDAVAFLFSLTHVNKVDLSRNKLKTLPSSTFSHMQNVKEVYLRHNEIDELNNDLFILPQLITLLDLGENRLGSLSENTFRHLLSVESLYLDSNLLDAFDGNIFPANSTLRSLRLSHNSIKQVSALCQRTSRLSELYLDNNQLTEIRGSMFEGCSYLATLHLRQNRIASMSDALVNLPQVNALFLQGNLLSVLGNKSFSPSVSLTRLELQGNVITELKGVPFQGLSNLLFLNVSRNALKTLNSNALGNLSLLQTLDLSNNKIVSIREGVFDSGTFQRTRGNIFLQGNVLTNVGPNAFNNITIGVLDMTNTSVSLPAEAFAGSTITLAFYCSSCSLRNTSFLEQLTNQDRLRTLDLSNQKHALQVVLPETTPIDYLILNDNELDSLSFLENSTVANVILDRTNTKKLSSGSNIATYHSPTNSLSLRGNNIESMEEISSLLQGYISRLDISENKFQTLFGAPDGLRHFKMDDNLANEPVNISGFFVNPMNSLSLKGSEVMNLEGALNTLGGFNNLVLNLDRWDPTALNQIRCPIGTSFTGSTLQVTHAGLTEVPPLIQGYVTCLWARIDLAYNELSKVYRGDFASHLGTLTFLNLSHNNIYSIESSAFAFTRVDLTIDLSHNKLMSIDNLPAWLGTPDLATWLQSGRRDVDVSHNAVQTVSAELEQTVSEKAINIDFNPFHCNCEMSWLPGLICDDLLADLPAGSCSTPTKLTFSDLVPEDIPQECLPPNIVEIQANGIAEDRVVLTCEATGDPLPSISWFLVEENGEIVLLTTALPPRDKSLLQNIGSVTVSKEDAESRTYKCEAIVQGGSKASQTAVFSTTAVISTTTTTTTTPSEITTDTVITDDGGDRKYNAGEMAGAIVCTLLIAILVFCLLAYFIFTKRHKSRRGMQEESPGQEMEVVDEPDEDLYDFTGVDMEQEEPKKKKKSFVESLKNLNPYKWIHNKRQSTVSEASVSIAGSVHTPPPLPPRDMDDLQPPDLPSKLEFARKPPFTPDSGETDGNSQEYKPELYVDLREDDMGKTDSEAVPYQELDKSRESQALYDVCDDDQLGSEQNRESATFYDDCDNDKLGPGNEGISDTEPVFYDNADVQEKQPEVNPTLNPQDEEQYLEPQLREQESDVQAHAAETGTEGINEMFYENTDTEDGKADNKTPTVQDQSNSKSLELFNDQSDDNIYEDYNNLKINTSDA